MTYVYEWRDDGWWFRQIAETKWHKAPSPT